MSKKELTPSEYEAVVASKGSKKSNNTDYTKYGVIALVALVLCGVSFVAGTAYQKGKQTTSVTTMANASGGPRFASGQGGGFMRSGQRPNIGDVSTVSSDSITIQNSRTNSDQTFKITSATTVEDNGSKAAVSDIKSGDRVVILADTSDTTTASQIMLNPSFRTGGPATNSSQESL